MIRLPASLKGEIEKLIVVHVIEEMTGGQHQVDERKRLSNCRVNADEQKLQKQTQFVRRRRSVFDSTKNRKKKLLQRPASLEITPLPDIVEY